MRHLWSSFINPVYVSYNFHSFVTSSVTFSQRVGFMRCCFALLSVWLTLRWITMNNVALPARGEPRPSGCMANIPDKSDGLIEARRCGEFWLVLHVAFETSLIAWVACNWSWPILFLSLNTAIQLFAFIFIFISMLYQWHGTRTASD